MPEQITTLDKREKIFWLIIVFAAVGLLVWQARLNSATRAQHLIHQGSDALGNGDPEKAAALFRKAEKLHPAVETELMIAAVYMAHEHAQKALPYAEKAVQLSPDERTFTYLGNVYQSIDNMEKASEAYRNALKKNPDYALALNNWGYYYADKGIHLKTALKLTSRAVQLEPDNGSYVDSLGWVYYRMGNYERAVEFLYQAAELEPGSAEIRYHLGATYAKNGQPEEAIVELRKALALDPEYAAASEELKRIE